MWVQILFVQGNISRFKYFLQFSTHIPLGTTLSTDKTRVYIICFAHMPYAVSLFAKKNTLGCTHPLLFIMPSYKFLKKQIRINLVKLTVHWCKSSLSHSSFAHLAFSQSSQGKRVSCSLYGKICNLCLPVYEQVLG